MCYHSDCHLIALSTPMTNGRGAKRSCQEDQSDPLEFESTDSEALHRLSEDDDAQARKRYKTDDSTKDTVRYTTLKKLKSTPKGSFGILAIRALLAKSGSSSTKDTDATRETISRLRRAGRGGKNVARSVSRKKLSGKAKNQW